MKIVRLRIETEAQLLEALSDFLIGVMDAVVEFGSNEEVSAAVIHGFLNMEEGSLKELSALGKRVADFAGEMAEIFNLPDPVVTVEIIADQDWSKNWKEHFKPFEIIPELVIVPSWEPYSKKRNEQVIVMDPGMAFGTGHHATTRLCLEMVKSSSGHFSGAKVLDVGTGTGILGMAAALWGASGVVGVDNDQEAIEAAGTNVINNNLQHKMVVSGELLGNITEKFQLVVANIVHDVLVDLADEFERVTIDGGLLVLSGLIHGGQTENIIASLQQRKFRILKQKQDGEWAALQFEKTAT